MSRRPQGLRGGSLLSLPGLVLAALGVLAGTPPTSAAADPISHCTSTKGVVVVVDFRHFDGAVDRGCSPTPTTGYDAMHRAGFTTSGDDQDGPAFVCRIEGFPTPAQQSCARTPPTSAAWSYWHADAGQNSWSFSELGAMSTHPGPGSVDAWVYGSTVGGGQTGQPSFSPASVRATGGAPPPSAAPSPSARPAPKHRHHLVATTPPSPTATTNPSPARTRPPRARHHAHHATSPASPIPATASNRPQVVDGVDPDAASTASSGSPTDLIVGAALVVVLAAAGGLSAWRRRRRTP